MTRLKCDAAAAQAAMKVRYERFEALSCYFGEAIKTAIAEHNKGERVLGTPPASPDEITMSLADAICWTVGPCGVERLIQALRDLDEPDGFECI